ncbi:MAG: serine/threonine protein kinase [Candidatus Hydrogenedentes bacterium]|nr:serine/threonine protein kinase [Candidatus Hydrogenedentota bacterium]
MIAVSTLGPGSTLGKYVITQELGRGGMGVVYLAEDTTLSRTVALKILYPALSSDTVFIERFKQEARVVANILHPSIVRINSFETFDSCHAIDMEYVQGTSLARLMANEVFTPQLAVSIARDVLDGLSLCHEHGVIHRDIKPSNILITEDGRAKLADFGLAIAYATHLESSIYKVASTSFFMGTPRYAPPEAWEGVEPRPDWDLYSFGLVLYEGLTGKPVFNGTTPLAIVKQLMVQTPQPAIQAAQGISEPFAKFIDLLISRDIHMRPSDAGAAMIQLRAVPEFAGIDEMESPTIRVRNAIKKARRSARGGLPFKRLAEAALILLVLAAAMLASFTYLSRKNTAQPIRQDELARRNILSVDEVIATQKFSFQARAYRARYYSDGALEQSTRDERWMICGGQDSSVYQLFGYSDRFLLSAELRDTGNAVTINGHWAEYGQPFGGGLRTGEVNGAGTWINKDTTLMVPLRFKNERDHTEMTQSVLATFEPDTTDTKFVCEMERAPLLQSLIFVDLRARPVDWLSSVESLLPCMFGSQCDVPITHTGEIPEIDGSLSEAFWNTRRFVSSGRAGVLAGRPLINASEMKAIVADNHLYVSLRAPNSSAKRWGVRFAFMPVQRGLLSNAAKLTVSRFQGEAESFTMYENGTESPWNHEGWTLALDESTVSCELAIPIASLPQSWQPKRTTVWRMNASVLSGDLAADSVAIAVWGFPDFNHVENGVLLHFDPAMTRGDQ